MNTEATIARVLAVIGLVAAIITVGMIARSSGVFGGRPDLALTTTTSPAAVQTATTSTGSFSALNSSGSAGGSDTTASSTSNSSGNATTATTAGNTYVVQNGDTFYSLAHKFNTTIASIQKLNPGIDPQNLKPGVRITVPAS
ncbi:MAG: LysM domain-containing protein [Actinomycetota bacterium]|jgi:LysM repeat protein|nr:LysM peptidoglycan-binding domain-containing protein [Actinomycetota bacterium]MCL6093046.1 LysM peptidoglycan-binding domain-containing protein [Actinomycetota bacterium]MDA8167375.1 LysM domain-containing protein [Actinomycetota bacterium]